MKEYDLISIGTGSATSVVEAMLQRNPNLRVAVIDKDEPGGICLTRGCIPSKILLYPAELVRTIEKANEFGIDVQLHRINFEKVMERMRHHVNEEIGMIRNGLSESQNIDYYHNAAEFVEPYTLEVGSNNITIRAKTIFLSTGSKPIIPRIKGLGDTKYHTSDTILSMDRLPESIAIVGGGYIAAEYGHFFSSMGSHVTIIGRNKQFLPHEEPEVSALAKRELSKHMTILTNYEVVEVVASNSITEVNDSKYEGNTKRSSGSAVMHEQKEQKLLTARDMTNGHPIHINAEEILIAAGRGPNTDILHPHKAGIQTDENGWIIVNEYLETSQPNIWAFGDANGLHPFKHKANYEAELVYYNTVLRKEKEKKLRKDYHAVPHAVFAYPEIAAVGVGEKEALAKFGENNILIGIARYEDTAKGIAMDIKDYFVKVIVKTADLEIIGAHLIGPYASVLIQEIVDIMYTERERTVKPILSAMHIHPALSEVVQRSISSLMPPQQYHHMIIEHYGLPSE